MWAKILPNSCIYKFNDYYIIIIISLLGSQHLSETFGDIAQKNKVKAVKE